MFSLVKKVWKTSSIVTILCLAMLSTRAPIAHAFPSPPYISAKFMHIYCLQSNWTLKELTSGDIASLYVGVPASFYFSVSYTGLISGYLYIRCNNVIGKDYIHYYYVYDYNNDERVTLESNISWKNPDGYDTTGRQKLTFQLCWWDGEDRSSTIILDERTVEVQVSNNPDVAVLTVNVVGVRGQPLYNADVSIQIYKNGEYVDIYNKQATTGSISVKLPYGEYYISVIYYPPALQAIRADYFNDAYYINLTADSLGNLLFGSTGTTLTARLSVFLEIFGQVWTFTTFLLWMSVIGTMTFVPIGILYKYRKRWSIHPMALCPRCGNELEPKEYVFWCQHCGWVAPNDVVRSRRKKYE